jgi:NitT/TauT family transport system substrate-binding protein
MDFTVDTQSRVSGLDVEYPWFHLAPNIKFLARTLLCLFVVLYGCGESSAAAAPSKIVLAYASMVARTSFIWIAREQGFFEKYGIDPELILISRGPVLIAGLTSGYVHVGNTGGTAALNAAVGGIELKLVATFNSRWVNNVVARSGIQSPKDLAKNVSE